MAEIDQSLCVYELAIFMISSNTQNNLQKSIPVIAIRHFSKQFCRISLMPLRNRVTFFDKFVLTQLSHM